MILRGKGVFQTLVSIGDLVSVLDDLLSDLVEVSEHLALLVQELGPLVRLLALLILGRVDQLQNLQEKPKENFQGLAQRSSKVIDEGRTRGLLVTIPEPRGRKSRPTMFSRTELFPLL